MKVYGKDEDGNVLFHSDTYLGEDYVSSNLKHWKYIKKEKKNGRWVYYYTDAELEKAKADEAKAVNDLASYQKSKGKVYTYPNGKKSYTMVSGKDYDNDKKTKELTDKVAGAKYKTAYISQVRSNTIEKTLAKLTVLTLNGVSSAISKGKSWFKKLFK